MLIRNSSLVQPIPSGIGWCPASLGEHQSPRIGVTGANYTRYWLASEPQLTKVNKRWAVATFWAHKAENQLYSPKLFPKNLDFLLFLLNFMELLILELFLNWGKLVELLLFQELFKQFYQHFNDFMLNFMK